MLVYHLTFPYPLKRPLEKDLLCLLTLCLHVWCIGCSCCELRARVLLQDEGWVLGAVCLFIIIVVIFLMTLRCIRSCLACHKACVQNARNAQLEPLSTALETHAAAKRTYS